MSDLREAGRKRVKVLEKIIAEKEKALKKAPNGSLRIIHHRLKVQYYHKTAGGPACGKYIRKAQRTLAAELAQKSYDEKVLQVAQNEWKAIQSMLKTYPKDSPEEVLEKIGKSRQDLIMPIQKTKRQIIEEWENIEYEHKGFRAGTPEFYTDRNERVRSKSEIVIANELNKAKIPYHYEKPLMLNTAGFAVYPDFTILNLRENKEIYWEHLGMMDDPQYCENALKKITLYEENGFFPGERLLLTHETKNAPLDVRLIRIIIKKLCTEDN